MMGAEIRAHTHAQMPKGYRMQSIRIRTHVHTRTHTHAHKHTNTHKHKHVLTCTPIHKPLCDLDTVCSRRSGVRPF